MAVEVDGLPVQSRLLCISLMFVIFSTVFVTSWTALQRVIRKFDLLPTSIKADTCSRINSTLHTFIVVPGTMYGLYSVPWSDSYEPLDSVAVIQRVFCVTVAYFLSDLVVLFMYRVPLWGVFAVHHITALAPLIAYLFIEPCSDGVFILAGYILTELSNVSLNAQAFLDQCGYGSTRWYAAALYTTFVTWIDPTQCWHSGVER